MFSDEVEGIYKNDLFSSFGTFNNIVLLLITQTQPLSVTKDLFGSYYYY